MTIINLALRASGDSGWGKGTELLRGDGLCDGESLYRRCVSAPIQRNDADVAIAGGAEARSPHWVSPGFTRPLSFRKQ